LNWKAIPFCISIVAGAIKLFLLLKRGIWFDVLAWIAFWGIWGWIFYAYWKDKDIPAYSGTFSFSDGAHKVRRFFYLISSLIAFGIVMFFG
jgi:hypothetical protein